MLLHWLRHTLSVTFFRTTSEMFKKSQKETSFLFLVTHDKKRLCNDENRLLTYSERCDFMWSTASKTLSSSSFLFFGCGPSHILELNMLHTFSIMLRSGLLLGHGRSSITVSSKKYKLFLKHEYCNCLDAERNHRVECLSLKGWQCLS